MNLHIGCIADAMTMSTNGVHNQRYIHDVTQYLGLTLAPAISYTIIFQNYQ